MRFVVYGVYKEDINKGDYETDFRYCEKIKDIPDNSIEWL